MANRAALDAVLAKAFVTDTLAGWTQRLTEADVLFSPVRDFEAVFSDPAVREHMVQTIDHPTVGELPLLRAPMRLEATPTTIRSAPPLLGQHTQEILAELAAARPQTKETTA